MSDKSIAIIGVSLAYVLASFILMLSNDEGVTGISTINVFFLCIFLLTPMAAFSVYLTAAKGYVDGIWIFLALFFTVPTFFVALGLPDKLAQMREIDHVLGLEESERKQREARERRTQAQDPCPKCGGRLNSLTGDCTKCGFD